MSDETTRALATVQDTDLVPTMVMTIAQARSQQAALQQYVRDVMVPNEDYGVIPGTQKPTLLKPGAEKLCEIYGYSIEVEITHRVEDWEDSFFHYEVKVSLVSRRSGLAIAQGVGSCNSREKRYVRQDACSLVNTVLKMAKKRALIDAALSATRSSGTFTQDMEDIADDHPSSVSPRPQSAARPSPAPRPTQPATPPAPRPAAPAAPKPAPAAAPAQQPAPASAKAQLWQSLAAKAAKPTAEIVVEGQTMKVPESFDSLSLDELGHYRNCLNAIWGAKTVAEIEAGWTKVEELDFNGDIGQPVVNQLALVAATRLRAITQPKQENAK